MLQKQFLPNQIMNHSQLNSQHDNLSESLGDDDEVEDISDIDVEGDTIVD